MGEQALLTPIFLGAYRLIAELGSGGMANLYLAVAAHERPAKLVVLKVLRERFASDPELVAMFVEEARLATRLHHANVVETCESGEEAERKLIVMEYLEGESLNHVLDRARRRGPPFSLAMHLRVLEGAMSGLHYAHELPDANGAPLGLVHRDVSPHNIFVTQLGQSKVLDFGIAKALGSERDAQAGMVQGKVRYMAPEQLAGEPLDRRADIFALGCLLWDAAAGERLWAKKGDAEVMSRVLSGAIPSPREINPGVSPALEAICAKALARNRDERYATCLALLSDLEAFMRTLDEQPSPHEIGAYVGRLFAAHRARRQRTIERMLGDDQAGALPNLEYVARARREELAQGPDSA
jgi:serine/threonine protein kinase